MPLLVDDYPEYADWIEQRKRAGSTPEGIRLALERLPKPPPVEPSTPSPVFTAIKDFGKGFARGATLGYYDPQDISTPLIADIGEFAGYVIPGVGAWKATAGIAKAGLSPLATSLIRNVGSGALLGGVAQADTAEQRGMQAATGAAFGGLGAAAIEGGGMLLRGIKARRMPVVAPSGPPSSAGAPPPSPLLALPAPKSVMGVTPSGIASADLEALSKEQLLERITGTDLGRQMPLSSLKHVSELKGYDMAPSEAGALRLIGPGGSEHRFATKEEMQGFLVTRPTTFRQPIENHTPIVETKVLRGTALKGVPQGELATDSTFNKIAMGKPLNAMDRENLKAQKARWKNLCQ